MRIRNLIPAATAAAMLASPAFAQDAAVPAEPVEAAPEATASTSLSAEQQASYDAWPPAQQAQYDAWPADTQTYFWTLAPERQSLFWRISDANKVTLAGLPAEQQAQAWTQIESQAAAMASPGAEAPTAGAPATEAPAAAEPTTDPTPEDPAVTEEEATEEPM